MKRLVWKLPQLLKDHGLLARDLRKAARGIGPNVAYEWADPERAPQRIHVHALEAVLEALEGLTGKPVALTDVMDWEEVDSPK